jgi:hypothetical protein
MSALNLFIIFSLTIIAPLAIIFYFVYKINQQKHFSSNQNGSLTSEHEKLKKRVETLEKIITDKNYHLKDEIDNL